MTTFRPATAADFLLLDGEPLDGTVRAFAAEEDGQVVGVCGLFAHGARYVVFSTITPAFKRNKRNFIRAKAEFLKLFSGRPRMPVVAEADPDIEGSAVLLKHVGFTNMAGDIYQWQP